jgi:hypothetical protein
MPAPLSLLIVAHLTAQATPWLLLRAWGWK